MWQVGQTGELISETVAVDALYAQVIRGDYKTLRITIRDGKLRITAPSAMSEQTIRGFLTRRKEWIEANLQKPCKKYPYACDMRDGGVVYLQGHPLTLRVDDTAIKTFIRPQCPTELIVASRSRRREEIREAVTTFLKERYVDLYNERAPQIIAKMPKKPTKVLISNAKTSYYGRCTGKGVVFLAWRVVSLPVECFDYLLTHELAHLVHMNHSKAFWDMVERYCPDYRYGKRILHSCQLNVVA